MPAIITDQIRVLNASNFVSGISTTDNSYYVFIGLPNATDVASDWNTNTPSPIDNFDEHDKIYDTLISAKKINSSDVLRVIRKNNWTSGSIYEMYRHDYSIDNLSPNTSSTSLYNSNYYIINSDFRVYECIYNGAAPSNSGKGIISLQEPVHTDLQPRLESDGYIWKYLYTIKPSDIIKFDSADYIPVPRDWGTSTDVQDVRNAAVDGKIEVIVIENVASASYQFSGTKNGVPIRGDGQDGVASVTFVNGKPTNVQVTNGGTGYTFATLDLDSVVNGSGASFSVIIPPPGGHGADVYRELGSNKVLVYSRIENSDVTNPDFPTGNQFARIGVIKNPLVSGSTNLLDAPTASGLYGIRLTGAASTTMAVQTDGEVSQTVGVGSTAIGKIIGYDTVTQVLQYWQDRSVANGDAASMHQYRLNRFTKTPGTGGSLNVVVQTTTGTETLAIDSGFTGVSTTVNNRTYYFGQTFNSGIASPEIQKYSGDIIYLDNRPEVTRATNQREDIKIILEF
jgi:hypothetical protein|tara:strand:+ start:16370 stop:17899 length:1530 start_codon:yes stop_codon:yes gene_type:complete